MFSDLTTQTFWHLGFDICDLLFEIATPPRVLFHQDGIVSVSGHFWKVLINRKCRGYTAVEY